jgi:hypothetical protein
VGGLLDRHRSESYYRVHGGRHHALSDARALRAAMPGDFPALAAS